MGTEPHLRSIVAQVQGQIQYGSRGPPNGNISYALFLQEPVNLRFRLAVLKLFQILRLNCSQFILNIVSCRPFRNT